MSLDTDLTHDERGVREAAVSTWSCQVLQTCQILSGTTLILSDVFTVFPGCNAGKTQFCANISADKSHLIEWLDQHIRKEEWQFCTGPAVRYWDFHVLTLGERLAGNQTPSSCGVYTLTDLNTFGIQILQLKDWPKVVHAQNLKSAGRREHRIVSWNIGLPFPAFVGINQSPRTEIMRFCGCEDFKSLLKKGDSRIALLCWMPWSDTMLYLPCHGNWKIFHWGWIRAWKILW